MEQQKKHYSERWTVEQERELIKARIMWDTSFQSKNCNPRQCWEKVIKATTLQKSVKNVTQKWQNILKKYKRMIQPQSGVSTEDGQLLPTQWEHFDELHDFLKSKHGLHPIYIIDQDVQNNAGPSCSSTSSTRMSSNCSEDVMEVNYDSTDEIDHFPPPEKRKKSTHSGSTDDSDHLPTPEKRKKSNKQDIMQQTSDDVRKSVRNIEKLVEFATRQMFPNAHFPELE